jgi:hypothetical protein
MDSPNRITNRNSGSQSEMLPLDWKFRRFSPQPHWKTATSRPYAAATESRLSTIEVAAITTDRNETNSSRNARPSTNASTSGMLRSSEAVKSTELAVERVTATSAPSTRPSVAGMTSSRSVRTARSEMASVPEPDSPTLTTAALRSGLTSTSIGSCICPVASALALNSSIAALTGPAVTSGAETTTWTGSAPPG